jgi:hypothetical protein
MSRTQIVSVGLLLAALVICPHAMAQQAIRIPKAGDVNLRTVQPDYEALLYSVEAPVPGGDDYKSFLLEQKQKVRQMYPLNPQSSAENKATGTAPSIGESMLMYRTIGTNPNRVPVTGGHPNDNALAINEKGHVVAAINSAIWAWDSQGDSLLLPQQVLSLRSIAGGSFTTNYFDPRVLAIGNRFVLVFLRNSNPATNAIFVLFSKTEDINDGFHIYTLPGNPDGAGYWTDFPAMAVSGNELFLTGNLIQSGVSWQLGFRGSLIWQIGLDEGFAGADSLNTRLYTYVKHNNKLVRNLLPVKNTQPEEPGMYFVSNRNFDVSNDTVFLVHIPNSLDVPSNTLQVEALVSNLPYGVPPNGRQANTNPNNPADGLQTNDGRPLAAIKVGNRIQYVANTVNPATGLSAIYHGKIDLTSPLNQSTVQGTILGSPDTDYGYPELAYTGDVEEGCDEEAIIAFNFTSPTRFPGVACIYSDNDGGYSAETVLKAGEAIVEHFPNTTSQRWGDYFGIQTRPGHPKEVWTAGYFGHTNGDHATWITQLFSPDSSLLEVNHSINGATLACAGTIELTVGGFTGNLSIVWTGHPEWTNATVSGPVCAGDTIEVTVTDDAGCSQSLRIPVEGGTIATGLNPNPFGPYLLAGFQLDADAVVLAELFNLQGQKVADLAQKALTKGKNELIFSTNLLKTGVYVLRLSADGKVFFTQKVIKE